MQEWFDVLAAQTPIWRAVIVVVFLSALSLAMGALAALLSEFAIRPIRFRIRVRRVEKERADGDRERADRQHLNALASLPKR